MLVGKKNLSFMLMILLLSVRSVSVNDQMPVLAFRRLKQVLIQFLGIGTFDVFTGVMSGYTIFSSRDIVSTNQV